MHEVRGRELVGGGGSEQQRDVCGVLCGDVLEWCWSEGVRDVLCWALLPCWGVERAGMLTREVLPINGAVGGSSV